MERMKGKSFDYVEVGSTPIPAGEKKGGSKKAFDEYAAKPKRISCSKALTILAATVAAVAGSTKATPAAKQKFDATAPINIEGWGNYAAPDRGDEIMPKSCWDLENFLKNPIYLWNHWHDEPIGIVTAIEAKDEGLYFSAQVGNPLEGLDLTDAQKKARSLLAQGIVKMNSVGFLPKRWHEDDDGNLVYDEVELLEISLVPIPMQQDSVLTNVKTNGGSNVSKKNEDPTATGTETKPDVPAELGAMKADIAAIKGMCEKMYAKMCPEGGDKPDEEDEEKKKLKKRIADLEAAAVSAHGLLKKHGIV